MYAALCRHLTGAALGLVVTLSTSWGTQAQTATTVRDLLKDAVVTVSTTGRTADGTKVDGAEGQGVIVFVNKVAAVVMTARHVVGPSGLQQGAGWLTKDDGAPDREIVLSFANGQQRPAIQKCETEIPSDLDVAVLVVTDPPVERAIPLERDDAFFQDEENVVLVARDPRSKQWAVPPKSARGILDKGTLPPMYSTSERTVQGESGAPWISVRKGLVVAIASDIPLGQATPGARATPVTSVWDHCKALQDVVGPRSLSEPAARAAMAGPYAEIARAIETIKPVILLNEDVQNNRAYFNRYWRMLDDFSRFSDGAEQGISGVKSDDARWLSISALDRELARKTDDNVRSLRFEYEILKDIDLINADVVHIGEYWKWYAYSDLYYENNYIIKILHAEERVAQALRQDIGSLDKLPESFFIHDFVFATGSERLKRMFLEARSIELPPIVRATQTLTRFCRKEHLEPCTLQEIAFRADLELP